MSKKKAGGCSACTNEAPSDINQKAARRSGGPQEQTDGATAGRQAWTSRNTSTLPQGIASTAPPPPPPSTPALTLPQRHSYTPTSAPTAFPTASNPPTTAVTSPATALQPLWDCPDCTPPLQAKPCLALDLKEVLVTARVGPIRSISSGAALASESTLARWARRPKFPPLSPRVSPFFLSPGWGPLRRQG